MRVVGIGVLDEAKKKHGDAPLSSWLKIAEEQVWTGLNDIRKTLPATDGVEGKFVFNVKGNTYRLIANINFKSQLLVIEHVMTHADYDKGGVEMSAARVLDYADLVSKAQPQVVHDEDLNEKFLAILTDLDGKWDTLTTEERKLHELLVLIIQDFEKRTYKIRAATPIEVIQELMEANGLKGKDLVGIFPTESVVSEVLSGKRTLRVEHIRRLSERFNVSPAVFF